MKTLEEAVAVVLQQDDGDYFERSRQLGVELMSNPAVLRWLLLIGCSDKPLEIKIVMALQLGFMVGREMEKQ